MCKQMLAATNFFRVDDLLVQIYNTEVEMAQDVAEITQKHLQQVLKPQEIAAVLKLQPKDIGCQIAKIVQGLSSLVFRLQNA